MSLRALVERSVALVLVTLLAAACGVPTDDEPRPIADERVPFGLLDPAATGNATPGTSGPGTSTTAVSTTGPPARG